MEVAMNQSLRTTKEFLLHLGVALSITLVLCGCATEVSRLVYPVSGAKAIDQSSPFLKVHLKDGYVYTLSKWTTDEKASRVIGEGELRDVNRSLVKTGRDTIPFSEVALFETNVVQVSPATAAMAVVTGGSVAMTIYCAANPKACFGSCPTFYAWDGEKMALQVEGFSSSILPVLEAKDIDPLYTARPTSRRFEIRMTNEAMETHVVRYADLLAIPRPKEGRVFVSPSDEFYEATDLKEPSSCFGPEGNILSAVRSFDSFERFSLADSANLAEREILELHFDAVSPGKLGLIVGFRESLMSTFLFYQTLSYLGNSAVTWLAKCQQGGPEDARYIEASGRVLGGIEVLVQDDQGEWVRAGEINETGPIAMNVQIVPFPAVLPRPHVVRLRMSKGLWRLNYVALASIHPAQAPIRIRPTEARHNNAIDEEARKPVANPMQTLVTFPGDKYTLVYLLPDGYERYELFVESRGYYLEWMRQEWLTDENPARAFLAFTNPEQFLKDEAPRFKLTELQMEQAFWRSKYERHGEN
jgi:hypothetical protein